MTGYKAILASVVCGSMLCVAQVSTAFGQGYNEDEWYDPTDWFDGNNYEYDDTLGLDYGGKEFDSSGIGYDDYYGFDLYDYGYYDDDWWDYDYGWDNDYDATPTDDLSYGWHYEWSPAQDRWTRQYGYYRNYYEYNPPSQGRNSRQQSQSQVRQPSSRPSDQRVLRGEIDSVRSVRLTDRTGSRARHQVAQVRLEDGRLVWVDLGQDQRNLRSTLNEGDRLVVRGQTGRISGRRVLMADQVQINGRSYQINRASQPASRQPTGRRPTQAQNRPTQLTTFVTGQVLDVQPVNFGGNLKGNRIRLRMQNGQTLLVDLGSQTTLSDLDIDVNDFVTVHGRRTTLNGRSVFRAFAIWVNGDQTRITPTTMRR